MSHDDLKASRSTDVVPALTARMPVCRSVRIRFELPCAVATFCGFLFTADAYGQDFQWWSEFDLEGSTRTVDVVAPFLVRLDPNRPNLQLVATGVTADVRLSRLFTLTGGYLFADLPQRAHLHV